MSRPQPADCSRSRPPPTSQTPLSNGTDLHRSSSPPLISPFMLTLHFTTATVLTPPYTLQTPLPPNNVGWTYSFLFCSAIMSSADGSRKPWFSPLALLPTCSSSFMASDLSDFFFFFPLVFPVGCFTLPSPCDSVVDCHPQNTKCVRACLCVSVCCRTIARA